MKLLAYLTTTLLAVPLVACTTGGERHDSGECPAGEVCSPDTPNGLHFIGNPFADDLFISGPSATAIGGTQEIALEYEPYNHGARRALDLPYLADDDGGNGVVVLSQSGSVVTVGGMRSRTNYLRIVAPDTQELYDRYEIVGAAIETMRLIGVEGESVPATRGIVWAAGDQKFGVALTGEVQDGSDVELQRIVDTSMALTLAGSERLGWDELRLPNATPGIHALTVEAGDKPAAVIDVEVVAGADSVAVIGGSPTVNPNSSTNVCFEALSTNRYIYGLVWNYNVDGVASTKDKDDSSRNCVTVSAQGMTSGSIPVAVAAGGRQLNVDVLIASPRKVDGTTAPASTNGVFRAPPTEGDRAAM